MTPHDQSARELAQEWQHRLLNGEVLTKQDHAAFIQQALRAAHDAGVKEGMEKMAEKHIMIFTDD